MKQLTRACLVFMRSAMQKPRVQIVSLLISSLTTFSWASTADNGLSSPGATEGSAFSHSSADISSGNVAQTTAADNMSQSWQSLSAPPWQENRLSPRDSRPGYQGRLNSQQLQALIDTGEHLFTARFTELDGAGRPMATQAIIPTKRKRPARSEFSRTAGLDANACSSCHHQPLIGGAGDFAVNVFVSEGFQHTEFDTTDPQFSNERNTNHLFGAGLLELLAREMTRDLQQLRSSALHRARTDQEIIKQTLHSKGVTFGHLIVHSDGRVDMRAVDGVDHDLVIRPFSHKGVMTSLRQFTINALNHHHGLQADERFGARWTGDADFDEDGHAREIEAADVSALVAWQASLAPPGRQTLRDKHWQAAARKGESLFAEIGCQLCHKPYLPLQSLEFHDPGPLDTAGTLRQGESLAAIYDLSLLPWARTLQRNADGHWLVPLFGDLKRHAIADQQVATLGNELLSQRFVERNVFMTSELWGVESTAPYGHRGDLTTLDAVIRAHGGDARKSRDAYLSLKAVEQSAIIAWLRTLIITP